MGRLSELFCAVLFTTVVRNDGHTYMRQVLSQGLGLGLNFVHLFGFSILCAFMYWLRLFCSCVVYYFALGLFFSVLCQEIGC